MAARAARVLIACALLALAPGCAGVRSGPSVPIPGRVAGIESDRERGYAFDLEVQKQLPLIEDLVVLQFVDDLGQHLVERLGDQPFDYRFRVIPNAELNAFAVPGGHIYLHSGTILSARRLDELAGVVAHELGHVKGRHSARMAADTAIPGLLANVAGIAASVATGDATPIVAAQAANVAIQLQYSRRYEDEADRMGVNFMTHAGFSPEGLVRFFERIQLLERRMPEGNIPPYLYSHPQVESRIQVVQQLAERSAPSQPPPAELLRRFPEVQARLAWLVENGRRAWTAVEPFDRSVAEPALAEAARLREAGRIDDALAVLAEAERAAPLDPRVPYRRAEILDAAGRRREAIAAYRRTVELDPSGAAVLLALGRAYKEEGDRRQALFYLEQARFRASPSGRARARIESEIERLIFPVVTESGFAVGEAARDAERAIGERAAALPAGARRLAWWGVLGPHWRDRAGYFRARWVAPDGTRSDPERLDDPGDHLVARRGLEGEGAAGPWRFELLYGDEIVHAETIAAADS